MGILRGSPGKCFSPTRRHSINTQAMIHRRTREEKTIYRLVTRVIKTGNQGDVGSNPAQGIKSFSSNENVIQKLSVHGALKLNTFRRGLDCESTVNPFVILLGANMRCWLEKPGLVTDLYKY